jgi:DNA-binding transcriptional regulator GbsR (MarR family)
MEIMAGRRNKGLNPKYETRNTKQTLMRKNTNPKQYYDLEDRTLEFARRVKKFVKLLPKTK